MGHPPNEGDFVRLYAQHQGHLFRYVTALVPHLQDAEDVFGEVTVTLWDNFSRFQKGTSFPAWARRIAHLRVLEYYRARDRRLVFPQPLLEQLAADFESSDEAADQRLLYLAECKEELAPEDRQLLEQRYVDNLRVQDLASRLARSEILSRNPWDASAGCSWRASSDG